MSAKRKKNVKGPSWLEVGLGAFLSIILGTALGAAFLVFKPVSKVTAIPKDPPSGAIYYIEGKQDFSRDSSADDIKKSFLAGQTVTVNEGMLNGFLADLGKPSTPAATDASKPAAPPPPKPFDTSALNARMFEGKIQFADTVTINVLGVTLSVIVQETGTFSKHGSTFGFDADTFYVGGCPMQRFIFLRGYVQNKLLFNQPVPDDLAAAWSKLVDVQIDSSGLVLKGPQS
jgi:hypothetical protein